MGSHSREIKKRLKEHGWEFHRQGGSHDIYKHPQHGLLSVSMNCSGRTLKELYKDIERGPRSAGMEWDAPAKPVTEPQIISELAKRVGFEKKQATGMANAVSPAVEWEGKKWWLRRRRTTEEEQIAYDKSGRLGRAPRWYYYLEEDGPGVGPMKNRRRGRRRKRKKKKTSEPTRPSTTRQVIEEAVQKTDSESGAPETKKQPDDAATLTAAEELLDELAHKNDRLRVELKDRQAKIESLQAELGEADAEIKSLLEKFGQAEVEAEELREKLKSAEAENQALRDGLNVHLLEQVKSIAVCPADKLPAEVSELRRLLLLRQEEGRRS